MLTTVQDLDLHLHTFYVAVDLMDRYYSVAPLSKWRDVSIGCLWVADKIQDQEVVSDGMDRSSAWEEYDITSKALIEVEQTILNALQFVLYNPLAVEFVDWILLLQFSKAPPELMQMSHSICQKTRFHLNLSGELPSLVAAASIGLACEWCGIENWMKPITSVLAHSVETITATTVTIRTIVDLK